MDEIVNPPSSLASRLRRLPLLKRLVDSEPVARVAAAQSLGRLVRPSASFFSRHMRGSDDTAVYELRGTPAQLVIRHGTPDVWTLNEIFRLGLYDPPPEVSALLERHGPGLRVVDLGANVGMYSVYTQVNFPHAQITAYEPDPNNLRNLRRCIDLNGSGAEWNLIEACATSSDGTLTFAARGDTGSHAVDPESSEQGMTVATRDVFPDLEGAHLLKMDIEGGEWELLRDERMQNGPLAIVMEYHPHLCDSDDPHSRATALLSAAGYETSTIFRTDDGHGMLWAWRAASGA